MSKEWTDMDEKKKRLLEYRKSYYINNKDKYCNAHANQMHRDWRKANVSSTLLYNARKRAKARNLPMDITVEDIKVPTYCPILNIPLEVNQEGTHKYSKNSPTLDRIKPELGYVKGNIQVISHLANVMKSNATGEELLRFADWIYRTVNE